MNTFYSVVPIFLPPIMHHRRVVIWSVQVVGALFLEVVSHSCQKTDKQEL